MDRYIESQELNERLTTNALEDGEHQANAVPADVDWELLHKDSRTLILSKDKNGKNH